EACVSYRQGVTLRGRKTGVIVCFFFQAEDGIRDGHVTGVQTCALPIFKRGLIEIKLEPPWAVARFQLIANYVPQELPGQPLLNLAPDALLGPTRPRLIQLGVTTFRRRRSGWESVG